MKRRGGHAAAAVAVAALVFAGAGLADEKTVTDAEGDQDGSPNQDLLSAGHGHRGRQLQHSATVAGTTSDNDSPTLYLNTRGGNGSSPEYRAEITRDEGPVLIEFDSGDTKPITAPYGDDTYRFNLKPGALGGPAKYGWAFVTETGNGRLVDRLPDEGFRTHRLD